MKYSAIKYLLVSGLIFSSTFILAKEKSKEEKQLEQVSLAVNECVHWNGEGRYNENTPEFEEGKTPCDLALNKLKAATTEFPANSDLLVSISSLSEIDAITGEEDFVIAYCNGVKPTMKKEFAETHAPENLYVKFCPEQAGQLYRRSRK